MIGYVIAGLMAAGWLYTLLLHQNAAASVKMLYEECVRVNERWKAAASLIALRSAKDAIVHRLRWSSEDEARLQTATQELERLGVSLQALEQAHRSRATAEAPETLH